MKFDYIHLINYRQYQNQKIVFSISDDKRFTVIQGVNGAGKTNLLNAITWCLFGKEMHIDSRYAGLPIINTNTLEQDKKIYVVQVEIQLIQNDGKKLRITREASFSKNSAGTIRQIKSGDSLSMMRETERDWLGPIRSSDAQFIINSLIPPHLEEYFFFDGEKMDGFFRKKSAKEIRDAVFTISQLELVEKLVVHLKTVRGKIFTELKKTTPEIKDDQNMLEAHTRSFDSDSAEKARLEDEKLTAEKMEEEYTLKLKTSSIEQVRDLEDQREAIHLDIEDYEKQIESIESDKTKIINRNMAVILTSEALHKTIELIQNSKAQGKIPAAYKSIFIQGLLNNGVCLCGVDISEKNEYTLSRRNKVKTYKKDGELSEISESITETNVQVLQMLEGVQGFKTEIIEAEKRLKDLNTTLTEKKTRHALLSNELSQINDENIYEWTKARRGWNEIKLSCVSKIGALNHNIDRRSNIIRGLESRIRRELKKRAKHNQTLNKITLCETVIDATIELRDRVMKGVRTEVERVSSEQFLSLIWKKKTYRGIDIDDNYNISVLDVNGRESTGTLSSGERQVCALSFMTALIRVSGFDVPLIIDTPLARISEEPSKNIALNLPDYLENKQVTLLVTEKEYSDTVKTALSDNVGKEYIIRIDEEAGGNIARLEDY